MLKFVSKSEMINQDDYDNDVKQIWSSYLNLVLNGLTTVQAVSVDPNNGAFQWNISEVCPLNLKSLRENFNLNADLLNKNEKKLNDLFMIVEDNY